MSSVPPTPNCYPSDQPSAYLNKHYEMRFVNTVDDVPKYEKVHIACDGVKSHKNPNPTLDAKHVMICKSSTIDDKRDIFKHCKSSDVVDRWNAIADQLQEEQSAFLLADDGLPAAPPMPSTLQT